jgi:hypothetical protein
MLFLLRLSLFFFIFSSASFLDAFRHRRYFLMLIALPPPFSPRLPPAYYSWSFHTDATLSPPFHSAPRQPLIASLAATPLERQILFHFSFSIFRCRRLIVFRRYFIFCACFIDVDFHFHADAIISALITLTLLIFFSPPLLPIISRR